jgi:5-amino-6-(5-phospho-D-ribitylamino)uracil phosphatase
VTAAHTEDRWLDVDGTVLHEDGTLSDEVTAQVQRVQALGHEVTLSTGRSVAMTVPILERLGIAPEYVVCANGAITLRRTAASPVAARPNYEREHVETFDPSEVLTTIRRYLEEAR